VLSKAREFKILTIDGTDNELLNVVRVEAGARLIKARELSAPIENSKALPT
jgi:hypothetical protein